jgi:hypothetical protein
MSPPSRARLSIPAMATNASVASFVYVSSLSIVALDQQRQKLDNENENEDEDEDD